MMLSTLLGKLGNPGETADGWLAHCPAHPDSNPSLRVAVGSTGKVLLRCRAGCETVDVLRPLGLSLADLGAMAADVEPARRALSEDVPASDEDVRALQERLAGWSELLPGAPDALAYLNDRFGVTLEIAERLGLGYTTELPGGPRVVIPFRDRQGAARGFQARALDPQARARWIGPKSPEGASWAKLGWFAGLAGWDEVLVCEGPGDALTGAAVGYDTVCVAGASLASKPAIADAIADMVGARTAVIAGDGDPAGRQFAARLAGGLSERGVRCRVADMPDGKDLTDLREDAPDYFGREIVRLVVQAREVQGTDSLAWDEVRYPLTDLGNAKYLLDHIQAQGSGVKYTPEARFMLLGEAGVWDIDELQRTRAHAQAVAVKAGAVAAQLSAAAMDDSATDAVRQRAKRMQSHSRYTQSSRGIDAMQRELQAMVPASLNDFDQHTNLLAVGNGVLDLRTGGLGPADADLLLSKRVEVDYDPNATCPQWERFLAEVFPDDVSMPAFLQRLIGYGITGETSEQIFVIHYGKGANGKSVFTDTLSSVFRAITTTTPFSTFELKSSGGIPNDLAALKGCRLALASEGEQGKPMAEAVLKRVTGRDMISARFLHKEYFEFKPQFLLQLSTNAEPNFRGQDEGLWRRVTLIRWSKYFKPHERDKHLPDKLLAESEGILAWAVRGAREWYKHGLRTPETVQRASDDYRITSDVLEGFLPGMYEYDPQARGTIGKTMFHDFQAWAAEENQGNLLRWSLKAFYAALTERGLHKRTAKGLIVIDGVRLADVTESKAPSPPNVGKQADVKGADLAEILGASG